MKLTIAAVVLGITAVTAQAAPLDDVIQIARKTSFIKQAFSSPTFEVKGRTGSTRIGGSGKSGKGSRYVGGRK